MIIRPELLVGRELLLERVFDAPRELLFQAWTDPLRLAQWWGPSGFTNPVCDLDVRPGGAWRIDMRGPDGRVYPMRGEYIRITEPAELVFLTSAHFDAGGDSGFEIENTVVFEDLGDRTKLKLRAVVMKARPADAAALDGMEQGWSQSLERLDSLVHIDPNSGANQP
jgi:uncharacterized protein YndB with AHSA1/START domain